MEPKIEATDEACISMNEIQKQLGGGTQAERSIS